MLARNEGVIDRWLRVVVGVFLILSAPAINPGTGAVQVVGLYLLTTAALGWCPIYTMMHLNTRTLKH